LPAAPLYAPNAPVYAAQDNTAELDAAMSQQYSAAHPVAPPPGAAPPVPAAKPLSGARVNIVGPDGDLYDVPAEQLAAAQARGYHIESDAERIGREVSDENPILSSFYTGVTHLASGLTFGASDVAIDHFSGMTPFQIAAMRGIEKHHPIAKWGGEAAGFAGSMAYGGEIFGPAGKAARAGAEAVTASLGTTGAKGLAAKMVQSGAQFGGEGLVMAAPKAFLQAVTGDPDLAAETFAWGVGGGAVLGMAGPLAMAAGGAVKGAFSGSKFAYRSIGPEAAIGVATKEAKRVGGIDAVGNLMMADKRLLQGAESKAAWAERIKPILTEEYGADISKFYRGVDEHLAAAKGSPGSFTDSAVRRGDDAAVLGFDWTKFTERGRREVVDKLGGIPGKEAMERGAQSYLDSFAAHAVESELGAVGRAAERVEGRGLPSFADEVRPMVAPGLLGKRAATAAETAATAEAKANGPMSFEKAWEWRRELDNDINWARKDVSRASQQDQLEKLRAIFQEEIGAQGEAIYQAMGQKGELAALKEANHKYAVGQALQDGVDKAAFIEGKNRYLSLSDNIWGAGGTGIGGVIGGVPGMVAGAGLGLAHKLVREHGNSVMARIAGGGGMLSLEKSFGLAFERMKTLPSAVSGHIATHTSPMTAVMDAAHSIAAKNGTELPTDKYQAQAIVAAELTSLASNPQKMQARIQEILARMSPEIPEAIKGAYAMHEARKIMYLAQTAPKSPVVTNPYQRSNTRPNDTSIHEWSQRFLMGIDPYASLGLIANRTLSAAGIDALRNMHPQTYASILARQVNEAVDGRLKPPGSYGGITKMSMFNGSPLDRNMEAVGRLQSIYSAQAAGGTAAQQAGPRKLKGPAMLSESVRIETRR
jgi:hypothetical protein